MAIRNHCDHCGIEIDDATTPLSDIVQIEPVAKAWPGGNFVVRVTLERCQDPHECTQWAPLDLCQQCFEYVLTEAAEQAVIYGDKARRRAEENPTR